MPKLHRRNLQSCRGLSPLPPFPLAGDYNLKSLHSLVLPKETRFQCVRVLWNIIGFRHFLPQTFVLIFVGTYFSVANSPWAGLFSLCLFCFCMWEEVVVFRSKVGEARVVSCVLLREWVSGKPNTLPTISTELPANPCTLIFFPPFILNTVK